MSESSARPARPAARRSPLVITIAAVAALVIGFYLFSGFYADVLWFDQLGFVQVLQVRWISMVVMFAIGFVAMALPLWLSVQIAFRSRPVYAQLSSQLDRYQELVEPLRRGAMWAVPIVFGLFAGVASASRWEMAQLWLHRQEFPDGATDPQFGLGIGFYVFELPFYQQVTSFAMAVLFTCVAATLATAYLYGAIRITGREFRISRSARVQLGVLVALWMAALALSIWLGQYATLVQQSTGGDVPTGVGFTEANASIPGQQILAGIAAVVAIFFIVTAIIGRWRISIVGTGLLVVASLVVGLAYPALIQRFQAEPSARALEVEYIQHNMDATQAAYGVDDLVEVETEVSTTPEAGALAADQVTASNIRLMDPEIVGEAFDSLQASWRYYDFPDDLDVDRYTIDGETYDAVIAARELDPDFVDGLSWYNQHIVYTHGYGVVAAYGNQRAADGRPVFLESGIPTSGLLGDFEPRVYFGESSPDYSIVGGSNDEGGGLELDYPYSEDEESSNATTTFDGDGGPQVGGFFTRLIYAIQFQSEQILFSNAVADDAQILYNRDPLERVAEVAPYLTLDQDPYPAVVDGELVWMIDGFTTSANYPYSTLTSMAQTIQDSSNTNPEVGANDVINYIRNSVKVTVNAYDGSVTLYAWDPEDPILQAWMEIYPGTVQPISEMSGDLLSHVRYPADLFKVQRDILGDYHVDGATTFYTGDDAWTTPSEPTWEGSAETAPAQPPYYLTMAVNGEDPAYTLYSTFIPRQGEDLLYGYMSVSSDAGDTPGEVADSYGQLTLQNVVTTGEAQVPGPGQAQNNFDTDSSVGQLLNILQQGQSEVLFGNLLTLPVGGGMLYVQPVYLQSTGGTSYPVLSRVLVSFGNQIAFEETLDAALDSLFEGDSGADAGDSDTPTDPDDPTAPEEPSASLDQQLTEALEAAGAALQAREDAYAENDLVAAAEADQDLQAALTEALELQAQIDGEAAGGDAEGDGADDSGGDGTEDGG